jgi:hypothetical protein
MKAVPIEAEILLKVHKVESTIRLINQEIGKQLARKSK